MNKSFLNICNFFFFFQYLELTFLAHIRCQTFNINVGAGFQKIENRFNY